MTLLSPLWLGVAAIIAAAALVLRQGRESDDWAKVMARPVLAWLRPETVPGHRRTNLALLVAALATASLATPVLPVADAGALRHAEAWIVMVDVSRSMTLADRPPDRLGDARRIALDLADRAAGRPVALVAYAGDAYLAQPFSLDLRQFRAMTNALQPGLVPAEGSDVARALAFASTLVAEAGVVRSRILLLTDTGGITAAANALAARIAAGGHRVDAIVVADPSTMDPVRTDLGAAEALAAAGGGAVLTTDAIGSGDLDTLLADGDTELAELDLAIGGLASQAHWLALACLPLILLLHARRGG